MGTFLRKGGDIDALYALHTLLLSDFSNVIVLGQARTKRTLGVTDAALNNRSLDEALIQRAVQYMVDSSRASRLTYNSYAVMGTTELVDPLQSLNMKENIPITGAL
ncbi:hypothetical protein N7448_001120 [Penicillium atrosanguineum]|uniref:Uncharacterized protein n=1 Tax=Penicillium atrosanguineum TaxID=1132637 RepID=A0A9W9Q7F8_9EURO|nr:uncharacterized protein N7443_004518 [Penicillium atrosanguineum]KAJ5133860.1 hypothetical protein N7526_005225 [Penicillium atrosanguineum]KAJ5149542.1 hypothetical protein N7448_001120 [Penicillium atrosanguineum]KAJ5304858.1 hypothetical protein N7443_004518 [Penicillium atrosanguineum]KAJ5324322.1 hypothetical protein N7476_002922 [Penicillium atrosanguineum]